MKIILCGFMGCGKSSIGRNLSKILDIEFIDMDRYIEAKEDTNAPLLLKKRTKDLCNLIPIGEYKFYLIDKVLLLPSEY